MERMRSADGREERLCTQCNRWLPFDEGSWYRHKRPSGVIGLRTDLCKACHCARCWQWQLANAERLLEQRRQVRLAKKYAKIGNGNRYGRRHLRTIKHPPGIPKLAVLLGV